MQRTIILVVLLGASVGLFFGVINPYYMQVQAKQATLAQYSDALAKSNQLKALRDDLLTKLNNVTQNNQTRLQKMLPNTVDNVRLILTIDNIAAGHNLRIGNIRVGTTAAASTGTGAASKLYGTIPFGFSVTADYGTFLAFLQDLEQALRVVDINSLGIKANPTTAGLYDFDISLNTYWLK